MRYCFATLLLVYAISAAPASENGEIQSAQFGMNQFNPYNPHMPYYYQQGMYRQNSMDFGSDQQQGALNPGKYMNMKDEDFPVDYSLQCSNNCGCRQTCTVIWWQPCTCRCPPPCGCNGCIWGCCGNRCCNQVPTTPSTPEPVEPEEPEDPPTDKPVPDPVDPVDPEDPFDPPETTTNRNCNGGSCCNRCSCMPCMMPIFWMCPPRCGSGCCGGSSNCCNGSNNSCCNSPPNCCNGTNNSCCNNSSNCCNGSNNSCC